MKDVTPNRGGTGSTYGGTQTPDPDAPDGYQKPSQEDKAATGKEKKAQPETDLGKEYDDNSSYGDGDTDTTKGGEGDTGNAEEGSPVR